MSRIRGKKFTIAQLKIINRAEPTLDTSEWLFHSEETVDDDGNKHAAKNSSKTRYIRMIHRDTGEIKKVLMP